MPICCSNLEEAAGEDRTTRPHSAQARRACRSHHAAHAQPPCQPRGLRPGARPHQPGTRPHQRSAEQRSSRRRTSAASSSTIAMPTSIAPTISRSANAAYATDNRRLNERVEKLEKLRTRYDQLIDVLKRREAKLIQEAEALREQLGSLKLDVVEARNAVARSDSQIGELQAALAARPTRPSASCAMPRCCARRMSASPSISTLRRRSQSETPPQARGSDGGPRRRSVASQPT